MSIINKMRSAPLKQLEETRERYISEINQLNLLLVHQHDLRQQQTIYQHQLNNIQAMIQSLTNPASHPINLDLFTQQKYLRNRVLTNQKQIITLTRKLQSGPDALKEGKIAKQVQGRYLKMVNNDFNNSIQHKLSTIRGKVDELKKKIKEINKEIIGYEQIHQSQLQEYSDLLSSLEKQRKKNNELNVQIKGLKAQIGTP